MVPLVAIVGGMVVVGGAKRASLMALERPDGDRSSGQPESTLAGKVENLGDVDKFKAGHGGHGLGGGGQGEAAVQAEFGRCVLPVSSCQVSFGVVPSKSYLGHQVGVKWHHRCPRWVSVVLALEIAGRQDFWSDISLAWLYESPWGCSYCHSVVVVLWWRWFHRSGCHGSRLFFIIFY